MNSNVKTLISFFAGGLVGTAVTYIFVRQRLERSYIEATDSMRRVYADLIAKEVGYKTDEEGGEDPEVLAKLNREKPDIMESAKKVSETHQFVDYSKHQKEKTVADVEAEPLPKTKPAKPNYYTISPEEFGDYEDYTSIFLTYYADGVVADTQDVIIEDDEIAESIGSDFADYFGEYEDDSVHIRNDIFKCDYQILADTRTFEMALKDKRLV